MTCFVLPATVALAVLLEVSACAPADRPAPYTAAELARAAPANYGVVVTIRPVPVHGESTGASTGSVADSGVGVGVATGGDVRDTILGAMGTAAGPGADPAFEFILREDTGQTISVVQANEEGLRPGERVVLSMGARTRLSRAAN